MSPRHDPRDWEAALRTDFSFVFSSEERLFIWGRIRGVHYPPPPPAPGEGGQARVGARAGPRSPLLAVFAERASVRPSRPLPSAGKEVLLPQNV